jgi:hypothetical protein
MTGFSTATWRAPCFTCPLPVCSQARRRRSASTPIQYVLHSVKTCWCRGQGVLGRITECCPQCVDTSCMPSPVNVFQSGSRLPCAHLRRPRRRTWWIFSSGTTPACTHCLYQILRTLTQQTALRASIRQRRPPRAPHPCPARQVLWQRVQVQAQRLRPITRALGPQPGGPMGRATCPQMSRRRPLPRRQAAGCSGGGRAREIFECGQAAGRLSCTGLQVQSALRSHACGCHEAAAAAVICGLAVEAAAVPDGPRLHAQGAWAASCPSAHGGLAFGWANACIATPVRWRIVVAEPAFG